MPLIDKPLEQLRTYRGINPRPEDFDAYWATSLDEMRGVAADVELRQFVSLSTQTAECFDLTFTGIGGARIYAKYLRPKRIVKPGPAVVQFHGYSANSGEWVDKLAYVNEGFSVLAMDCRGQGGKSQDVGGVKGTTLRGQIIRGLDDPNPRNLLFRSIFLDAAKLIDVTMSLPGIDPDRIGVMGGSQGGGLALACAALEPRVKRTVSVFPFLCDYQRVWEMDLAKDAFEELAYYFRRFDPRHERQYEVFSKLGYIDCQHLSPRITADVLMFTGLMDTICPPSTQFAAYNKISSRKEMRVYPDFGHEHLPDSADLTFNFLMKL